MIVVSMCIDLDDKSAVRTIPREVHGFPLGSLLSQLLCVAHNGLARHVMSQCLKSWTLAGSTTGQSVDGARQP